MGSPLYASLQHRLSSVRAVTQSFEADLATASVTAKPDIELLIRFFKDAEQNIRNEIELFELTHGGIDARKVACAQPERYVTNAPAPPREIGDMTPQRPRPPREECIALKKTFLESDLSKAEARGSELRQSIENWYLCDLPEWEKVTADARRRWTGSQQLAIEQYRALKLHHEQMLDSQTVKHSENREGHGTITGSQKTPDPPFLWSEINAIAADRLKKLDGEIRAEISTSITPPPAGGGARHQFFVVLEEKASAWAHRAKNAYLDCLTDIGREPLQSTKVSIWQNGLKFFVEENLRQFLILACAIGRKELEWAQTGSAGVRATPQVAEVVFTLHQIDGLIQKVSSHLKAEMTSSGNWLVDAQRLIGSLPSTLQTQSQSVTLPARASQIDSPASRPIPMSAPAAQPVPDGSEVDDKTRKRESLVRRIMAAPRGMTFRNDDAACACNVTVKTICNWVDEGKLEKGAKRATVTAESLKRLI